MAYISVVLFLAFAVLFVAVAIGLSAILGGRSRRRTRLTPYECGVTLLDSPRRSFAIRFYLVAILFILFDLEAVYLYPWAALFRELGLFGLVEMGLFILILIVGYLYAWKRGALEWE